MPRTHDALYLTARTRVRIPVELKTKLSRAACRLGLPQAETERLALSLGADVLNLPETEPARLIQMLHARDAASGGALETEGA